MSTTPTHFFGGQGSTGVKLCPDCEHRPAAFARGAAVPACLLRPAMDAIAARDDCKGADWTRGR